MGENDTQGLKEKRKSHVIEEEPWSSISHIQLKRKKTTKEDGIPIYEIESSPDEMDYIVESSPEIDKIWTPLNPAKEDNLIHNKTTMVKQEVSPQSIHNDVPFSFVKKDKLPWKHFDKEDSLSTSTLSSEDPPFFSEAPTPRIVPVNTLKMTVNVIQEMKRMTHQRNNHTGSWEDLNDSIKEDPDSIKDDPDSFKEDITKANRFVLDTPPKEDEEMLPSQHEPFTIPLAISERIKESTNNPLHDNVKVLKETRQVDPPNDMDDIIESSQDSHSSPFEKDEVSQVDLPISQIEPDSITDDLLTPSQPIEETDIGEVTLIRDKFIIPSKAVEEEIVSEPFTVKPSHIIQSDNFDLKRTYLVDALVRILDKNLASRQPFTVPEDFPFRDTPMYSTHLVHHPPSHAEPFSIVSFMNSKGYKFAHSFVVPFCGSHLSIEGTVIHHDSLEPSSTSMGPPESISSLSRHLKALRLANNKKSRVYNVYIKELEHQLYFKLEIPQKRLHAWRLLFQTGKTFQLRDLLVKRFVLKNDKELYNMLHTYDAPTHVADVVYIHRQGEEVKVEPKFPSSQKSDMELQEPEEEEEEHVRYRCKIIELEMTLETTFQENI